MTRERPKDEPNSLLCDLQHRPARQRSARLSVRAAERPPSLRSPRLSAVRKRGRCHSPRAAVPHPRFHSRTNMLQVNFGGSRTIYYRNPGLRDVASSTARHATSGPSTRR